MKEKSSDEESEISLALSEQVLSFATSKLAANYFVRHELVTQKVKEKSQATLNKFFPRGPRKL